MIRMQERDKAILKVCYEQQFLLTEHIRDHFFGGNYAEAKRRIIELRKEDYLQGAGFRIGQKCAHILGHRGMPIAEANSNIRVTEYPVIDRLKAEHDAIVTDIRLRLENEWNGKWTPEIDIQADHPSKIPDGIFEFGNELKAAIEVENSLKGRKRFQDRLLLWRPNEIDMVIYFATTEEIYESLKSFLEVAPRHPSFYLVSYDAFRSGDGSAWHNKDGHVQNLLGGGRQ